MSIEKKSLISSLKTTKKANVASLPAVTGTETSRKGLAIKNKGLAIKNKGLAVKNKGLAIKNKAIVAH
jgi:hypothetical protein